MNGKTTTILEKGWLKENNFEHFSYLLPNFETSTAFHY
jgi:hypothetical protein